MRKGSEPCSIERSAPQAQPTSAHANVDLPALPAPSHACNADADGLRDASVPIVQAAIPIRRGCTPHKIVIRS